VEKSAEPPRPKNTILIREKMACPERINVNTELKTNVKK
jgi:hypothetical protein